jgi:NAD-dependent dihydropyrimidine dehydrogenase PreA subunit
MAKRLSVVISQSPSKNPKKRKLEEDIVLGLMIENGIDVTIVPNLYDLKPDGTGMLALKKLNGNLVVCSWLFERAAHWVLDRNQIHGHVGETLLKNDDEAFDDEAAEEEQEEQDDKDRVIDQREIPDRKIYCLDFKTSTKAADYIEEIKRIHQENAVQVVGLGGSAPASNGLPVVSAPAEASEPVVQRIDESDGRRWYPVIDYSRCTNCMECIDFCLFGVYGVDRIDTILVEQPDNCRKGCPACSRVCPENAIMFPQHKTPAIAGSADVAASMKIDLSQLFGAPASGKSAEEIAAMERDEQLVAAGRDAVGMQGLKKRQEDRPQEPKDDLDSLVDQLDDFDI